MNLGAFCSLSIFRTWWLNCTFSLPVVWATFHTWFNYPLSKIIWYPLLYIGETFTVLIFLVFKFLIFILLLWDILLDFTRHCEYGRLNKLKVYSKKKNNNNWIFLNKFALNNTFFCWKTRSPTFNCWKRKKRQFVRIFLLVENRLNGKFFWPNLFNYGFKTQSLTWTLHEIYSQLATS